MKGPENPEFWEELHGGLEWDKGLPEPLSAADSIRKALSSASMQFDPSRDSTILVREPDGTIVEIRGDT